MRSPFPLIVLALAAAIFALVFGASGIVQEIILTGLEIAGAVIAYVFPPFLLVGALVAIGVFYRRILRL